MNGKLVKSWKIWCGEVGGIMRGEVSEVIRNKQEKVGGMLGEVASEIMEN